jgi:hypothetical protein
MITTRSLITALGMAMLAALASCKKESATVDVMPGSDSEVAVPVEPGVQAGLEKFRQSLKHVTIDDVEKYVVEGDVLLDEDELTLYYLSMHDDERTVTPAGSIEPRLIVMLGPEGKPIRWPPSTPLTYAVLRRTFRTDAEYNTVVNAIGAASDDWEKWCAIDFQHRADLDGAPGIRVPGVTFVVRGIDAGGAFLADAFPPNAPEAGRRILVDWSYFTSDYDPTGVFRHELGHILGFRHEHIRALPNGIEPNCPPENTTYARAITEYDPKSVMHYPCQGVDNKELALSADDQAAAATLYGPPGKPQQATGL